MSLRLLAPLAFFLLLQAPAHAETTQLRFPELGCAVSGLEGRLRPGQFCSELGRQLSRPMTEVDDARSVETGQSIQVLGQDVQLIVAVLRNGRVEAWTRVSRELAHRRQAQSVAVAVQELMMQRAETPESCLRIKHGRRGRPAVDMDLTAPWEEFEHCETRMLELAQPWQ